MIYLLAFITIYILSAWRAWWFLRMAHYHPDGKLYKRDPDNDTYWLVFCPLMNTIFSIVTISESWKINDNKDNIFKPKKPLK